jgi:hypothetical protein
MVERVQTLASPKFIVAYNHGNTWGCMLFVERSVHTFIIIIIIIIISSSSSSSSSSNIGSQSVPFRKFQINILFFFKMVPVSQHFMSFLCTLCPRGGTTCTEFTVACTDSICL